MLLIGSITYLLETRRSACFRTTLHKTRAHALIRGNDLADGATKLAVTDFDTLPPTQKIRVNIGKLASRSIYWVMYTVNSPIPDPAFFPTLRRPWWTIPEAERL